MNYGFAIIGELRDKAPAPGGRRSRGQYRGPFTIMGAYRGMDEV
ncbi:hypothetical protein BBSC_1843 [Bifidobacterium scardovii JCM 12489 = DSM 13734]|nr:hypothetical protein BBSC_1843 [Bifidobacterium scardovii JCM 12489 = DSM 13734]